MPSRLFAIGDVHGCAMALEEVIDKVEKLYAPNDRIVFLGDYIDRGADSKDAVAQILALKKRIPGAVTCLKGNHEQWLLEAFHDWTRSSWLLGMDGLSTVASYSHDAALTLAEFVRQHARHILSKDPQKQALELPYARFFEAMPESHKVFFQELEDYATEGRFILSHAGLDPKKALEEQSQANWFWSSPKRLLRTWRGPQTLIVGHLPTFLIDESRRGLPIVTPKLVCLDTGVSATGVLTAMRFPDRRLIQGREH